MGNDRRFEDQLDSYLGDACRREQSFSKRRSQLVAEIEDASRHHAEGRVERLKSELSASELKHKQALDAVASLIDALHPHTHAADRRHPRPRT